ncbi:hypothetical protein [Nocardia sp. NPDC052566]|uniref:hypothetical protein n=1 Tax=Nocardia sp. NPDC052566 TaxID=3364330 RepID=UPI0037CAD6B5
MQVRGFAAGVAVAAALTVPFAATANAQVPAAESASAGLELVAPVADSGSSKGATGSSAGSSRPGTGSGTGSAKGVACFITSILRGPEPCNRSDW